MSGRYQDERGTPAISRLWIVVPIATFGLGSALPFVFAAIRLRRRVYALFGAGYAAISFVVIYLLNTGPSTNWQSSVGAGLALTSACVATAQILAAHSSSRPFRLRSSDARGEDARQRAIDRIRRRQEARQIVERDPNLADELHIGRPDLAREFDDGGLIDVNHVPAAVLERLPDVSEDLVQRIVSTREAISRFESIDDLSVSVGCAPQTFDHLKDLLIFR